MGLFWFCIIARNRLQWAIQDNTNKKRKRAIEQKRPWNEKVLHALASQPLVLAAGRRRLATTHSRPVTMPGPTIKRNFRR